MQVWKHSAEPHVSAQSDVSTDWAFGSSGTVRCSIACAAASAEPKTTLADESFTHSTH